MNRNTIKRVKVQGTCPNDRVVKARQAQTKKVQTVRISKKQQGNQNKAKNNNKNKTKHKTKTKTQKERKKE